MPEAQLLVIGLSSPLLVGVYQNGLLHESYVEEGQASDTLPRLLARLSRNFRLTDLAYARGPGSYMAIKLVYVALKTLAVATGARFWGTEGFAFNGNAPIRAAGKRWFVRDAEGQVAAVQLDLPAQTPFALPQRLDLSRFEADAAPRYILDAI